MTEATVPSEDDGLRATPHAELVEHLRDLIADGFFTQGQPFCDFGVAETLRDQRQDRSLTRREGCERGIFPSRRGVVSDKLEHHLAEASPGAFVLQQDVIL
jgi:hypothetical protein